MNLKRTQFLNLIINYIPQNGVILDNIKKKLLLNKKIRLFSICVDQYYMYDYIFNKRYTINKKVWKRNLEYLFNKMSYDESLINVLKRICDKSYYITLEHHYNYEHKIGEFCIFLNTYNHSTNDLSNFNINIIMGYRFCGMFEYTSYKLV